MRLLEGLEAIQDTGATSRDSRFETRRRVPNAKQGDCVARRAACVSSGCSSARMGDGNQQSQRTGRWLRRNRDLQGVSANPQLPISVVVELGRASNIDQYCYAGCCRSLVRLHLSDDSISRHCGILLQIQDELTTAAYMYLRSCHQSKVRYPMHLHLQILVISLRTS